MRAYNAALEWHRFLLGVGNGQAKHDELRVQLGDDNLCSENVVTEIFGQVIEQNGAEDLYERAILAPKNVNVKKINDEAMERLRIERPEEQRMYKSVDEAIYHEGDSGELYRTEYLNSLDLSGMPPHELKLKRGAVVMLLRNLYVANGLCNGTRLKVETLGGHVLGCRFICGERKNNLAVIPRINNYWDKQVPYQLRRRQFPLRVAFAMTINKSQGQSFNVFSQGQLYIAFSRVQTPDGLKVQAPSVGEEHSV